MRNNEHILDYFEQVDFVGETFFCSRIEHKHLQFRGKSKQRRRLCFRFKRMRGDQLSRWHEYVASCRHKIAILVYFVRNENKVSASILIILNSTRGLFQIYCSNVQCTSIERYSNFLDKSSGSSFFFFFRNSIIAPLWADFEVFFSKNHSIFRANFNLMAYDRTNF